MTAVKNTSYNYSVKLLRASLYPLAILLLVIFTSACGDSNLATITSPAAGFVSASAPEKFEVSFSQSVPEGDVFFLNGTNVTSYFTQTDVIATATGEDLKDHLINGDNIFRVKKAGIVLPVIFHYDNGVGPTVRIDSIDENRILSGRVVDPSGISQIIFPEDSENMEFSGVKMYADLPTEVHFTTNAKYSYGVIYKSVDGLGNFSETIFSRTGVPQTNGSAIQIREKLLVSPDINQNSTVSSFVERSLEKAVEFSSLEGRKSFDGYPSISISDVETNNIELKITNSGLTENNEFYIDLDFTIEDFLFDALLEESSSLGISAKFKAHSISFKPRLIFRNSTESSPLEFDFDYLDPTHHLLMGVSVESDLGIFDSLATIISQNITIDLKIGITENVRSIIYEELSRLLSGGVSGLNLIGGVIPTEVQHIDDPLDLSKRILTFPVDTYIHYLDADFVDSSGNLGLFSRAEPLSPDLEFPTLQDHKGNDLDYDIAAFVSSNTINQALAGIYQQINLPVQTSNGYTLKFGPGMSPFITFEEANEQARIRLTANDLFLQVTRIDDPSDVLYNLKVDINLPIDLAISDDKLLQFSINQDPIFKVTETVKAGPVTLSKGAMDGILNYGITPLLQKLVGLVELDMATLFVNDDDFYYSTETIAVAGETTDAGAKPYLVYAAHLDQNHDDGLASTIISSAPLAACIENSVAEQSWGTYIPLELRDEIRKSILESIRENTVSIVRAIIENPATDPFEKDWDEWGMEISVNQNKIDESLQELATTNISTFTQNLYYQHYIRPLGFASGQHHTFDYSLNVETFNLAGLEIKSTLNNDNVTFVGELNNPIFNLTLSDNQSSAIYQAKNVTSPRLSFAITISKPEEGANKDEYFYYFTLLPLRYDLKASEIDSLYCGKEYPTLYTLEGIELFEGLKYLDASYSILSNIDLSSNKNLQEVILRDNTIENLVTPSENTELRLLDIRRNTLTADQIIELENLIGSSCGLNCELDIQMSKPYDSEDLAIDDIDFADYVIEVCSQSSASRYGWLYASEVEIFECGINVNSSSTMLSDLGGMENFTNLITFDVTSLGNMEAFNTNIFPNLEVLKVGEQITPYPNIAKIWMHANGGFNEINQIILSDNPKLRVLNLAFQTEEVQLPEIDLSQNPILEDFRYFPGNLSRHGADTIDMSNNPSLSTIMIESLGSEVIFPNDLANLKTLILVDIDDSFDISSATNLEYLEAGLRGTGDMSFLPIESAATMIHLGLEHSDMNSFNLSAFDKLLSLTIYDQLSNTAIDLSALTSLKTLKYSDRIQTSLDLSELPLLESLEIIDTPLLSLDLSSLSQLKNIGIEYTDLTTINLDYNGLLKSANLKFNDQLTAETLDYLNSLQGRDCGDGCELSITY